MKGKQRGDDHKLYCPTCKAGRNCMDHLMIRENDLQEQVTQLKADLATPCIVRAESHCVWLKDGTKVRLNCTDEGNFELQVADTLMVTTAAIGKE